MGQRDGRVEEGGGGVGAVDSEALGARDRGAGRVPAEVVREGGRGVEVGVEGR